MHFHNIILVALVSAAAMSVQASSPIDAGVEMVQQQVVARGSEPSGFASEHPLPRRNNLFSDFGESGHKRMMMRRRHSDISKRCSEHEEEEKDAKKKQHHEEKKKGKGKEHKKNKGGKKGEHHHKGTKEEHKKKKTSSSEKKKEEEKKKSSSSSNDSGVSNAVDRASSNNDSNGGGGASHIISKAKGLFGMTFGGSCKNPNASDKFPNGDINFLNCGISKSNPGNGKWSPPDVKMNQLRVVSSDQAAKSSAFGPCAKYKDAFDSASKSTGVPAVLLMSFAMQESTCNPGATGGNGEVGMMQITPDKCQGNCRDPHNNVMIGAKYFKQQLDGYGGNILQAIGQYNGWTKGMTYSRATSQQYGCAAQNNLDYLNQMLNGWAQGKDGNSLGVYKNLAHC